MMSEKVGIHRKTVDNVLSAVGGSHLETYLI
jgi:hypothetical protein